jgi:hypothetical protein
MADVFLSYARSSLDDAMRIAECLQSQGFSVWFDQSLPAHRAYTDVIAEQLDAAKSVVVLWSEEAVHSQWVRSEANRARETGRLVQARLDDARLPMPFDQIQCADLRHWHGQTDNAGCGSIVASIAALTGGEPVQPAATAPPAATRRTMLIGGATAAVAAAGLSGWYFVQEPRSSPEAKLLLQKGMEALQANDALETEDPGSTLQAIAFLRDATEADPGSAEAWGGLAAAYAVRKRTAPPAERSGLDQRARSAAQNSLSLKGDNVLALGAMLMLSPVYHNWLSAEREHRQALSRQPKYPLLLFLMSDMLGQVGRWKEAAELSARLDRKRFRIPGADRRVIVNLWSAGDLEGADQAARIAAEQWPQHPQVWRTRIAHLLFSGRPAEALDLLANRSERPPDTMPELVDAFEAIGEALTGRRGATDAVSACLAYLKTRPAAAMQVAQAIAALGDPGKAIALSEGYYFGQGEWADLAPPGGDADRLTAPLFQPPMKSLWKTADFDRLLERIGLNDYWRKSRTLPDFRHS